MRNVAKITVIRTLTDKARDTVSTGHSWMAVLLVTLMRSEQEGKYFSGLPARIYRKAK